MMHVVPQANNQCEEYDSIIGTNHLIISAREAKRKHWRVIFFSWYAYSCISMEVIACFSSSGRSWWTSTTDTSGCSVSGPAHVVVACKRLLCRASHCAVAPATELANRDKGAGCGRELVACTIARAKLCGSPGVAKRTSGSEASKRLLMPIWGAKICRR